MRLWPSAIENSQMIPLRAGLVGEDGSEMREIHLRLRPETRMGSAA
jgi:hypothetical protein